MASMSYNSESEDDIMIAFAYSRRKRRKRQWVHEILQKRSQLGEYHKLVKELELDNDRFRQYFRLTREQFAQVLHYVGPDIQKCSNRYRTPISPNERLAICLRFLATGDSFKTIAFSYRVGTSTVGIIVREVCQAIWKNMSADHMPTPQNADDWLIIADLFSNKWNFPNCVGAIDGKHVVIQAPRRSGSLYFNYKGTFSIVLMAAVDASYRFIMVDIGSYGRNSDGGVLAKSEFGKALDQGKLHLPPERHLPGSPDLGKIPYVFIGDEAFPLKTNLMRPFPGKRQPEEIRIFNYRLSRARRIVENAFGILAARWRLYHRRINLFPNAVKDVVKATCVLHNFLQTEYLVHPDQASPNMEDVQGLQNVVAHGARYASNAMDIRNKFKSHFNSEAGSVAWQWDYVRRGQLPQ